MRSFPIGVSIVLQLCDAIVESSLWRTTLNSFVRPGVLNRVLFNCCSREPMDEQGLGFAVLFSDKWSGSRRRRTQI